MVGLISCRAAEVAGGCICTIFGHEVASGPIGAGPNHRWRRWQSRSRALGAFLPLPQGSAPLAQMPSVLPRRINCQNFCGCNGTAGVCRVWQALLPTQVASNNRCGHWTAPSLREQPNPCACAERSSNKWRTRPGLPDDQGTPLESSVREHGWRGAQALFTRFRSSHPLNCRSLRGRARFRLRRVLAIHQTCRPPKARAAIPSCGAIAFRCSIAQLFAFSASTCCSGNGLTLPPNPERNRLDEYLCQHILASHRLRKMFFCRM